MLLLLCRTYDVLLRLQFGWRVWEEAAKVAQTNPDFSQDTIRPMSKFSKPWSS